MLSILFFFLGLLESRLRKVGYVTTTYGVPRFFKRVQYYTFKVTNIQVNARLHR